MNFFEINLVDQVLLVGLVVAFFTAVGNLPKYPYTSVIVILITLWLSNLVWDFNRPEQVAQRAVEQAEKDRIRHEKEIPHVIREKDGCKVYEFYANRHTHYYTVCPNSTVTTDTQYTKRVGNGSVTKTDTIITVHEE